MTNYERTTLTFEPVWQTTPQQFTSSQYLNVDDNKRSRASSDPGGLHICIVPEITITCEDGRNTECTEEDEFDAFLIPPVQRPRSNTCPEEMFRSRKGRPPTPPPEDVHVHKNTTGKRFSFNFAHKDINGVSFAQHRLSKVNEENTDHNQKNIHKKVRSSSITAHTNLCSSSSNSYMIKSNSDNNKDKVFPLVNPCRFKPTSSMTNTYDTSLSSKIDKMSVTEGNNSVKSNNNEKHATQNDVYTDVFSCSSGSSKENSNDIVTSVI